jgi:chitodextrinase
MNKLIYKFIVVSSILIFAVSTFQIAHASLVGNTSSAVLTLSPQTGTYNIGDTFTININANTAGKNITAVASYLKYNPTILQAISTDITGSPFTVNFENTIDATNGKIKITQAAPAPGVNTTNGLIAKINFKTLKASNPSSDNITFDFTSNLTNESNVLDGTGTDFLSGVYNAKITVGSPVVSDTTTPSVPSGLSASAVSTSQINLSWDASSDAVGVTGYKIYKNGSQISTTASTSYQNTGLSAGTAYSYTISAYDAAGNNSTQSASASATTLATSTAPYISSFIATPSSIMIGNSAALSWVATGNPVPTFSINSSIGTVTGSSKTVYPTQTTTYTLTATNSAGIMAKTATVTVTPLPNVIGDFNGDYLVNSSDLTPLISVWNTSNSTYDLNNDSIVNSLDYAILVQNWDF